MDYKIGQKIQKKAKVKNRIIDLRPEHFTWSEDALVKDARQYERPHSFFRGYNVYKYFLKKLDYNNWIMWPGYMGDSLSGSHRFLPANESQHGMKRSQILFKKILDLSILLLKISTQNQHSQKSHS